MASTINAQTTPFAAVVTTADGTGNLAFQTANVTALTIGTDQVVTLAQPLPASSGGTGTTSFPSPGTAGNVLTSNGSAWTSATPPANDVLARTFPLKSGASLSAGRVVNINSSGEVGDYPAVNTLGSIVTNTGGYAYNQFSTDGSRALYLTAVDPPFPNGGNCTLTIRGMAVTSSSFTNGTVTVTSNINVRGAAGGGLQSGPFIGAIPINATQFLVFFSLWGYGGNNDCSSTDRKRAKAFVVTVDSSGNCTKGNEITYFSVDNSGNSFSPAQYRFVNGLFAGYISYQAAVAGYYFTVSGTTVTATQDNDFYNYYGTSQAGATFGQVTSGNIAVNTGDNNSNTLYKATWNGSALGTPTSETIMSSAVRIVARMVSPTLLIAAYTDGANVLRISTFTINQSTGAATLYATLVLDSTWSVGGARLSMTAESSTKYLLTGYNAGSQYGYSFEINSSGDILGTGIKLLLGLTDEDLNPTYTGASSTYRIANYSTKTQNFVVNSYNTAQWNSLGVSQTSQNTSPATIVTDGVASGFTGLTPGTAYYVNTTTYDGTVTSTPGVFLVGLAVSSTQISLGL